MFISILVFYYVGLGNEIDSKIRSKIDGCRHFDSISIPIITRCLNTTMPQNKRDNPESSFSVDMACQT